MTDQKDGHALLRIRNLKVSYAGRGGFGRPREPAMDAVQGVGLTLERGRIHGLAGESGSGKSTLARCLVGLLKPTEGSIRLDGAELISAPKTTRREAQRRIQLVFQDPGASLSPRRTIAQTLCEPARQFGLQHSEPHLVGILESVGLDASALGRLPRDFSSGQRQRIAIARALVCEPDVLVADEALASLDVSVQANILDLLRALCHQKQLGLLLISHDLAVLRENADELSIMYRGHVVEQGPASRVFSSPAHPYTRQLLAALPPLDPAQPGGSINPSAGLAGRHSGPGCVFQHRCDWVIPQCRTTAPNRRSLPADPAHHVECDRDSALNETA